MAAKIGGKWLSAPVKCPVNKALLNRLVNVEM
jgi:hypothetical protein